MTPHEERLREFAKYGFEYADWAVKEIERLRMFYESSQEALAELIQEHTACQGALEAANDLIRTFLVTPETQE